MIIFRGTLLEEYPIPTLAYIATDRIRSMMGRSVLMEGYLTRFSRGEVPSWGIPPGQVRTGGTPAGGLPPGTGQHTEYLLCRGQYASCVHAGELSCFIIVVYHNCFFSLVKILNLKNNLFIDNHYSIICKPFRIEYLSGRVNVNQRFPWKFGKVGAHSIKQSRTNILISAFQWRIRDFLEGDANLLLDQLFPKTAWKWRNFDQEGAQGTPPRSTTALCCKFWMET